MTLLDLCNEHSNGSISKFLRLIDLEPTEPHYREMVKDGVTITPFVKSALEHKFRDLSFEHLLDERYAKPKTKKIFIEEQEEPVAELVLGLNEVVQESHSDSPAPIRKPVGKESKPRPEKRGPYKKTVRASTPTDAEIDFLKAADEKILNYTELKDRKRVEATEENSLREDEVTQSKTYIEEGKVVMRNDTPAETDENYKARIPIMEEMHNYRWKPLTNWFGFAEKMPDPSKIVIVQRQNQYKIGVGGFGCVYEYPKNDTYPRIFDDLEAADRWAYLPE